MYEFLDYRVSDVMTEQPITVGPRSTLADVEAIFEEHEFNGLPVVGSDQELLGLVTKLDVLKAFLFDDDHMFPPYEEIMQQRAASVMTTDPLTVTPRAALTRVLEKLVRGRFKSLPVVDDGRVVGMIGREDVLMALREATAEYAA